MLDSVERERLIEAFLPLVRSLARRHAHAGEAYEDLVQVGALGLVAAARRYDPDRGVPFAAFAAPTVDGELRRHLRDRVSTVRVPRREQALAAALRRAAVTAAQRLGREAALAEVAAAAGVTREHAEHVLSATAASRPLTDLELDAPPADESDVCASRASVQSALGALDPAERQAVALRFGADLSQTEIAARLSISQAQTSRLLQRALVKLRRELDDRVVPESPGTS